MMNQISSKTLEESFFSVKNECNMQKFITCTYSYCAFSLQKGSSLATQSRGLTELSAASHISLLTLFPTRHNSASLSALQPCLFCIVFIKACGVMRKTYEEPHPPEANTVDLDIFHIAECNILSIIT